MASLDPELLALYRRRFPESVVTSLCAVPIDKLSDFAEEKEVLLRGPFFQILGVDPEESGAGRGADYRIEAVALNTNRDHISAIASNEGDDREMRDAFRALIVNHRSALCAQYCEERGAAKDAAAYRDIAASQERLVASLRD
jgi:hypothetical protein